MIDDDITITIVNIQPGQVKLAIEAPIEKKIYRKEIYELIKMQEDKQWQKHTKKNLITLFH